MTGIVVAAQSHVVQKRSIGVSHNVNMRSSASVVTGEDGSELCYTITVRFLNSAQPGVVEVGLVRVVAIAACNNARINSGGIAMPHLEVYVRNWLTSVDIDNLIVEDHFQAFLPFDEIFSHIFARDIWILVSKIIPQLAFFMASTYNKGLG